MGNHEFLEAVSFPLDGRRRFLASVAGYPDWMLAVEVAPTDSGPTISEIRILSRSADEEPTPIPAGGIPSRLIRKINTGELLALLAESLEGWITSTAEFDLAPFGDEGGEILRSMLASTASSMAPFIGPPKRPGSAGNGIDHYLLWAVRYVEKVQAGERHPVKALAAETGKTETYIRDTITDARRRHDLLTKPGQGRAGGRLTEKAHNLMAERQAQEAP